MVLITIALTLAIMGYAVAVYMVYRGWKNLGHTGGISFEPEISLLIPARNESGRIKNLLQSLKEQHYSLQKIQIILIDDHSDDHTVEEAENIMENDLEVIRLADIQGGLYGKKAAIETGVNYAIHDIIVMVDADSVLQKDGLSKLIAPFGEEGIQLVAGPVLYADHKGILNQFQQMDMLANNGMAAAGFYFGQPFLCNGTNLAFRKKAFEQVNGFAGNQQLASGDDVFLLQKINKAFPGKVKYIKDSGAVVVTAPQSTLTGLVNQRKRWASKSVKLQSSLLRVLLISGYLLHFSLLLAPLWFFIAPDFILYFIFAFFIKFLIEYLLISKVGKDLQTKVNVPSLFFISLLYIPYVVMVGILAIFTNYKWKGRIIKK
jgi:poly-beta-1,6-N-acetyl-D-glucosamine synthase